MATAHRLAVLGDPIEHSLSPRLHLAAYRALGLDWDYTRRQVSEGGLASFLDSLDADWRGLSLTMPLKRAVLGLVDEVGPLAAATGTANTVLLQPGGPGPQRRAFNTDVPGLCDALCAAGVESFERACILGAGATAACAVYAAALRGAAQVRVAARTPRKARWLEPLADRLGLQLEIVPLEEADRAGETPDVVVSTLPGGVRPATAFRVETRRHALLFDVSYAPWPSPLAETWREEDGRVLSGLALLVHQALLQVRVFVGASPDAPLAGEESVRRVMLRAVGLDDRGFLAADPQGPRRQEAR